MTTADLVNSAGLLADIAGVILLWRYGLPAEVRRSGAGYWLLEETDEAQIAKAKRYDAWARGAVALLAAGFLLQLVSNFL